MKPQQQAAGKNSTPATDRSQDSFKRTDDSRRETGRSNMGAPAQEKPERSQRETADKSATQRQPGSR
jgi:hypothetical protein